MSPLITAATLHEQHADVLIVDCRHDLLNPGAGRAAYLEGHIPNAIHVDLDLDLSGNKTGSNGRHPLPEPAQFAAALGRLGINPRHHIIAYDAHGGMYAARLWWLMRWLGHDRVQVLDGGWQAWLSEGGASSTDIPENPPSEFPVAISANQTSDAAEILRHLGDGSLLVVDARAPSRFAGQGETLDPVGGHIPGAVNHFFQDNLQPDGRFKSADALNLAWRNTLGAHPVAQSVQQCGSGVTACHNLLALEIAGLPGSRLYPGSWSEWCADPARPIVQS